MNYALNNKEELKTSSSSTLQRYIPGFAGPDPYCILHRNHKDLTVPDLTGSGSIGDYLNHPLHRVVIHYHFQLNLGQQVDIILGAPVDFHPAFLEAAAHDLADRHPPDAELVQRFFNFLKLGRPYNALNLFQASSPLSPVMISIYDPQRSKSCL